MKDEMIEKVTSWWEEQNVGDVYVYDAAAAKDPNWFKGGRAEISVDSDEGGTHKPGFVGAADYLGSEKLDANQITNAITNAINHEVFTHQFKILEGENYDFMFFNRELDWVEESPYLNDRKGTVVDAHIKNDPKVSRRFYDGPVPAHPDDTAAAQEKLRQIDLKPPKPRN